jgi:hypothetical protein
MRQAPLFVAALLLLLSGTRAGSQGDRPEPKTGLEKEADAWLYPGAKALSTGGSGGRVFQSVLTTDDEIDKVLKHYDKKCGTSLAGDDVPPGVFDSASETADGKTTSTQSADDSTVPLEKKAKGKPRGVTLRQLTRDEPGFFVTVLVTRAKDDGQTHLLVTYLKK